MEIIIKVFNKISGIQSFSFFFGNEKIINKLIIENNLIHSRVGVRRQTVNPLRRRERDAKHKLLRLMSIIGLPCCAQRLGFSSQCPPWMPTNSHETHFDENTDDLTESQGLTDQNCRQAVLCSQRLERMHAVHFNTKMTLSGVAEVTTLHVNTTWFLPYWYIGEINSFLLGECLRFGNTWLIMRDLKLTR